MSVNLALVHKAGPLQVERETSSTCSNDDGTTNAADALTALYENYASLYPNPQLAQERMEQDRLLRAISAAQEATECNPAPEEKPGFFHFLWGTRKSTTKKGSLERKHKTNQLEDKDDERQ